MVELTTAPEATAIDPADIFLIRKGDTPGVMQVSAETLLEYFGANSGGGSEGSPGVSRGAHRYWRVRMVDGQGRSDYFVMSEVTFQAEIGKPRAFNGGGVAIASSTYGGSNPASNVFDGNLENFWESASGANPWIGYDFGAPQEVREVILTVNATYPNERLKSGFVEYSDDNVTWTRGWLLQPAWGQAGGSPPITEVFADPEAENPVAGGGGGAVNYRTDYSPGVPTLSSFTRFGSNSPVREFARGRGVVLQSTGGRTIYHKTVPAGTMRVVVGMTWNGHNTGATCNAGFFDPVSGKFVAMRYDTANGIYVQKFDANGNYQGEISGGAITWSNRQRQVWFGLRRDANNIYYEFSSDGVLFNTVQQESIVSGWLAGAYTNVFFGVDGGAGFEVACRCFDTAGLGREYQAEVTGSSADEVVVVGFKQHRLYITAGNNASQVCMGELRCYDAVDGGTDVTDARDSIQFSGEAGSNKAANVFDNDDGNGWFDTQAAPNFIGFKLAQPVAIKRITIGLFFQSDYMPRDFKFQGSNDDGATWTDLLTVTGKTNWAAGQTAFLIP